MRGRGRIVLATVQWIARGNALWATLAVAASISLGEINRLTAESLSAAGFSYAINDTVGLFALGETDSWAAWASSETDVGRLIVAHVVFDVLLIAGYAVLAWRLLAPSFAARAVLLVLVSIEALEGVLLLVAGTGLDAVGAPLALAIAIAGTAKMAAILTIAVTAAVHPELKGRIVRGVRRGRKALYVQRLPLIVVLTICALALLSGGEVLEQLPDVQRQWFGGAGDGVDVRAIVFAIVTFALLAFSLYAIGRQRAEVTYLASHDALPPRERPRYWPWLAAAGVVLAIAGLFASLLPGFVDPGPLAVFVAVPVVLVGVSALLRLRRPVPAALREDIAPAFAGDTEDHRQRARDVLLAGDALAAFLAAVGLLAIAKAFAVPYLLAGSSVFDRAADATQTWLGYTWIFPVALGLGVVTTPLVLLRIRRADLRLRRLAHQQPTSFEVLAFWPEADRTEARGERGKTALVAASITANAIAAATILFALVAPEVFASIGVAAATVSLIGSWTILISTAAMLLGRRRPLEIFQLLRRRTDPLLTLLIVVPLVVGQFGGAAPLHALRSGEQAADPADRPDLMAAFEAWNEATECALTTQTGSGTVTVKPLLLVAAEGGGIRAATWTVDVLREFAHGDCAASTVFLSSGASGGSVGLAAMRDAGASRAELAARNTVGLGEAYTLATAVTGLLGRDVIAAATGIRIPSLVDGEPRWQDRAGFIEAEWEARVPQLAEEYDFEPSSLAGYVVLNSTAAGLDCKVVVSQIDFDGDDRPQDAGPVDCNRDDSVLGGTIDLHDVYGDCPLSLSWATAAMLSARFAFVTPGGRVSPGNLEGPGCEAVPELQLIDGGYTDNTGLGTLEAVSPELVRIIHDHNDAFGATDGYVVPIVMYLSNGSGADIVAAPPTLQADLALPLSFFTAPSGQLTAAARLERISNQLGQVCTGADGSCEAARSMITSAVPHGVVFAAPGTEPSLEVPLGWTLSVASRSLLQRAVNQQLRTFAHGCDEGGLDPDGTPALEVSQHYGTLSELMCTIEPPGR